MEQSFLEKNLEHLSKYNKKLADKLAGHNQLSCNFEFVEAKVGDVILSYNDTLLHDDVDPQEEALDIFNSVSNNTKSSIHVLFGIGLSYLFKRFSLSSKGNIILFEPNLDILRITFEAVDLSEDLKKNSIVIIDSKEEFQEHFEKFYSPQSEVSLSFLKSYVKMFPEIIKDIVEELTFCKGLLASSHKGLGEKAHLWTLAGAGNIPEILNNLELEILRKKFKNKPAVIISAGPSLDNNIEVLKEFQDKAVIFCVGTALKTANIHNIKPDFLTVVEHNDCSFQVAGVDVSDMNMIVPPMVHKFFQTLKVKRKFNYYSYNDFSTKWLANIIGVPLDDYLNKGTVSLCALFSAKIMGCNPIIVIGQDLAYTNGYCYSKNSTHKDFKVVKNEETGQYEIKIDNYEEFLVNMNPYGIHSRENLEYEAKKRIDNLQSSLYFVKGHNNEMIPTESGYATFIRHFENTAQEFGKEIKFINSTEGGAYLEGFEHIPLRESLEKYAVEKIDVESIIQKSMPESRDLRLEKGEEVLKEYDKMIAVIEETIEYSNKINEHALKLQKLYKLKRFSDSSFKIHIKEIITNFLKIEENINKNIIIYGFLYTGYTAFHYYLNNSEDITSIESVKELIGLSTCLFGWTTELNRILNTVCKPARERLYENCCSTCK